MAKRRPARRKAADLSYISPDLQPLAVPLDDLQPDPANARRHDERQIAALCDSLARFGAQKNVVAFGEESPYTVIAGNGTLEAAQKLGWTHLPVNRFTTEAQARAFSLADNRIAEMSTWQADLVAEQIAELKELNVDVAAFGFSDEELDAIVKQAVDAAGDAGKDSTGGSETAEDPPAGDQSAQLPDVFRILVECRDEEHQLELLERFTEESLECRALNA